MPGTAFRARHGWKESSAEMLGRMVHNFNSSLNFLRKPDRRGHVPSYLLTRQHFHMVNPQDCKFISMFFVTKTEQTHHKPLIFPLRVFVRMKSMRLFPHPGKKKRSKFEEYREAWGCFGARCRCWEKFSTCGIRSPILSLQGTERQRMGHHPECPALKAGALHTYVACPQKNCSGSSPLLIFWFLLTLVLRVAVQRWILFGNVLWTVARALISR